MGIFIITSILHINNSSQENFRKRSGQKNFGDNEIFRKYQNHILYTSGKIIPKITCHTFGILFTEWAEQ